MLDAAGQFERAEVQRLLHIPPEDVLRKVPFVLVPVGLLVPLEAERRVQHPVPVPAQVAPRVFVPDTGAGSAAPSRPEQDGPLRINVRADAVLPVVAVPERLDRGGARVACRVDLRAARSIVVEDVGRRASRDRSDGDAIAVHEADYPALAAASHRCEARQLRFRPLPVVHHVDDIGGQPVAAPPVAVVVCARAQRCQLADGPVGAQVGKRVPAPRFPAASVELVQVGHARPVTDQPVPAWVGPEVGLRVEPLVVVLVDVVVREVAREFERSVRRHDLRGNVLALVPGRALHPVGRLLPDRRDPGPRRAAEQRSGLDPCGESLAPVLADRDGCRVDPLRRRMGCQSSPRPEAQTA